MLDFELPAVLGVIRPNAFQQQRFPNTRSHEVADDRYRVILAFRHKARDRVPVLFIVERDALDGPADGRERRHR